METSAVSLLKIYLVMSPVRSIARYISPLHLPLTFFMNSLPAVWLFATLSLLSSPDTTISESPSAKKLFLMVGNLGLGYMHRKWFKGKELLSIVWKFAACNLRHWQATTFWAISKFLNAWLLAIRLHTLDNNFLPLKPFSMHVTET